MLTRRLSEKVLNASITAQAVMLNGGFLDIYDGPQPAGTADAPDAKKNTLLATLRFKSPAFMPASGGAVTSFELEPDTDAKATGVAAWYRLTESDHKTVVEDGSIGRVDCNMVMNATAIQEHAEVSVKSVVLKVKA
jgi:hypothetical protein